MAFDRKHDLGLATIPIGDLIDSKRVAKPEVKSEKSCFYNKSHDRLYMSRFSLVKDIKD